LLRLEATNVAASTIRVLRRRSSRIVFGASRSGALTRQTSVYLDLIRFTAALIVFLGRTSGQRMTGGLPWPIAPSMNEPVTIFFVLSGYVIAYVCDRKERSSSTFIVSRAARIYSVALPARILTFSLDSTGRSISPHLYNAS
jgi:peptidoglycan/LPS O-acetylase OafA/YrhL